MTKLRVGLTSLLPTFHDLWHTIECAWLSVPDYGARAALERPRDLAGLWGAADMVTRCLPDVLVALRHILTSYTETQLAEYADLLSALVAPHDDEGRLLVSDESNFTATRNAFLWIIVAGEAVYRAYMDNPACYASLRDRVECAELWEIPNAVHELKFGFNLVDNSYAPPHSLNGFWPHARSQSSRVPVRGAAEPSWDNPSQWPTCAGWCPPQSWPDDVLDRYYGYGNNDIDR